MRRNKPLILLALVLSVALVASCGSTSSPTKQASTEKKAPFRIGAILSISGDYAGLGGPEKKALEMEVAKLNKAGGVNGFPVEVTIEDDATDPAKAVSALSKLLTQKKIQALIGCTGTGQSMAIAKDIEKNQLPVACPAGGSVISNPVQKWVFQIPWPNTVVVDKVIEYLKSKGYVKVSMLTSTDGFGDDGKKVLEKKLPAAGIEIAGNETFDPKGMDFKSQLTTLKNEDADAIIVWNAGKAASIVLKNMKELKIKTPFIGSHGNARKEFIEGAGAAAEGAVIPAGKIMIPASYGDSPSKKLAEDFIAEFKSQYGEEPNGTFPGHAYDSLYMLVNALEKMKATPDTLKGADLRDEMEKTAGLNLLGGSFTYSATDHFGTKATDLIMVEVKGGQFGLLK